MFGIALGRTDAELILLALESFDREYAAPEEQARLAGIIGALRVELNNARPCGDAWVDDVDGRVYECRRSPHTDPWHSDSPDGDGRLWRNA